MDRYLAGNKRPGPLPHTCQAPASIAEKIVCTPPTLCLHYHYSVPSLNVVRRDIRPTTPGAAEVGIQLGVTQRWA